LDAMRSSTSAQSACPGCGSFTKVNHHSTFCKVTGESNAPVHWCCPGRCEIDATRAPEEAPREDLGRGATKVWAYDGAVLEATDDGCVSVDDLLDFALFVRKHHPNGRVILHAYGLRVTKTAGMAGPRLEWRDWD
jgi:hypothetical protein